ncbi:SDR family NAD(P)-dependent oxidoreductase [Streptomyces sp. NPDC002643]
MSDVRFDGQVVIVTGAGRGLGRAYALLLAERGATVVVNDLGGGLHGGGADASPAEQVVDEIRKAGGTALANTQDVSTSRGCNALVSAAVAEFGRVDGIIHSAGHSGFTPIPELHDGAWEAMLAVHLDAAFHLTRAAWPHFVRQGGGNLLYITSSGGLFGSKGLAHYGTAKTGLLGLARVVSVDGAEHHIRANVLAVEAYTRLTADALRDTPNLAKFFADNFKAEHVSPAAAWLLHPTCPANGHFFHSQGARFARIAVVEAHGYWKLDPTIEDLRDNFATVADFGDLGDSRIFESIEEYSAYAAGVQLGLGATPPEPDTVLPA